MRTTELSVERDIVMATERTLSIIKPDATRRNLTGSINHRFESRGLRIVAQKRIRLTEGQAERLEDGPLLDVKLEVGGGGVELGSRCDRRVDCRGAKLPAALEIRGTVRRSTSV